MIARGFPGLHPDSAAYVVPAFARNAAGEPASPVYAPWFHVEPKGSFAFDFHGPLQTIVLRKLFRCADAMDAVRALGVVGGIAVAVSGLVRELRRRAPATAGEFAAHLAHLAIVAQVTLYLAGRPELFVLPMACIGLLVATRAPASMATAGALGALTGLAVLAAPASGVLAALVLVAHLGWTRGFLGLVRDGVVAAVAGLGTMFVVAAAHPWSLAHLARKTMALRELGGDTSWSPKIVSFWLGRSAVPLLGVAFAGAAVLGVVALVRHRRNCRTPVVAALALAAAVALVVRNSVLVSATHYNVLGFTGIVLAALATTAPSRALGFVRAGALAVAALPFAATIAGFVWYERDGVSIAAARARIDEFVLRGEHDRVGFDQWGRPNAWVAAPRLGETLTFASWRFLRDERDLGVRYAYVLVPVGAEVPQEVRAHFGRIESSTAQYAAAPAFTRWVVAARTRPDYAFDVWARRP